MKLTEGWEHATKAAWAKHGAEHDFRYRHPVVFFGAWVAVLSGLGVWLTSGMWSWPNVHVPGFSFPSLSFGWGWWVALAVAGVAAAWRAVRWLTTY